VFAIFTSIDDRGIDSETFVILQSLDGAMDLVTSGRQEFASLERAVGVDVGSTHKRREHNTGLGIDHENGRHQFVSHNGTGLVQHG
jgi:hypothetical protein